MLSIALQGETTPKTETEKSKKTRIGEKANSGLGIITRIRNDWIRENLNLKMGKQLVNFKVANQ